MASNAKALSFLSGDLSLSGSEVSINVAGSVQSDTITGSTITMKNTGSTIVASDGTTAVLSETSGTVTLTADTAVIEGSSSGDLVRITQTGSGNALVIEDSTNPDSTPFVVDSNGNVGIGTSSPATKFDVASGNITMSNSTNAPYINFVENTTRSQSLSRITMDQISGTAGQLLFSTTTGGTLSERMRIDSSGNLLVGKESTAFNIVGAALTPVGEGVFKRNGATVLYVNRGTDDGDLIRFFQADILEGNISVSGSTVSYNGGHLSRWSQLADNTRDESIVKGTVMSNLDQMAEWTTDGVTEDNEQLNCMKVSDVEGDRDVAGVFVNWDNDDDIYVNDMNIAMTGDMVIRIAQGTTVQRGDLLMSAGDGTAKPQGDDIVRSKTIAKVTSTYASHTYEDGSYLVPCVLMAC
jgi:hypothetical protein